MDLRSWFSFVLLLVVFLSPGLSVSQTPLLPSFASLSADDACGNETRYI